MKETDKWFLEFPSEIAEHPHSQAFSLPQDDGRVRKSIVIINV